MLAGAGNGPVGGYELGKLPFGFLAANELDAAVRVPENVLPFRHVLTPAG
jgi:hypothetical protein